MALTIIQVNALRGSLRPDGKQVKKAYKVSDAGGLYIEVTPKGGKRWRFKYRFNNKEKLLSLGIYPDIGLKEARERRDSYRNQIANGTDPAETRKAERQSIGDQNSFEVIAREWFSKFSVDWSTDHAKRSLGRLEKDIFPWIGKEAINELKPPKLLSVFRRIESRGAIESARRAHQICSQIFRYAVRTGRAENDPTIVLQGAIPPTKVKHHASITEPVAIGGLMRAISGYEGAAVTISALKLAPYVFVRPTELRNAEWSEIDLDNAEWRIPAEKMKMKAVHIIPLSEQAITILRGIEPLTGRGKYVFPSSRTTSRPMSNNTINGALRRLGYSKDEMTGHGFRSMASTLLNEQGWNRDAVERQLAHSERDGVRAAYNYAQYLPERKKMMQSWANYLDGLAKGADIIPINRAG